MRAILQRDFVAEGSRTRAVILRTLLGSTVAFVAAVILWEVSGPGNASEDEIGRRLFCGGAISLLVLLFLLTPPLVVGSSLAERVQGTLDLLLVSPVGPRSIALAKLLSRCGVALLSALAALPILGLPFLYGGVALAPLLGTIAMALAVVLEVGAFGLWISAHTARPATAAVLSYVVPAFRWYLFSLPWMAAGFGESFVAFAGVATTPVPGFVRVAEVSVGPSPYWIPGPTEGPLAAFLLLHPSVVHLAFAMLLAAAMVLLAGARLRREAEPARDLLRRLRGTRRLRDLPRTGNPIAWKEVRLLNTASSRPLFYGVLGLLLLVFAFSFAAMDDETGGTHPMAIVLAIEIPLVAFVAAVNGSLTLGHERTQGSWDLLRTTRLRPVDIVLGKLAGVFRGVAFLALVPVMEILGALVGGALSFGTAIAALGILAVLPAFWAAVGLSYGIRADRHRQAVVRTCVLFGVMLVGFPCLALVAMTTLDNESAAIALLVASPPVTAFTWVVAAEEAVRPSEFSFLGGRFPLASLLWLLFYACAFAGLLRALPRWLARRLEDERAH